MSFMTNRLLSSISPRLSIMMPIRRRLNSSVPISSTPLILSSSSSPVTRAVGFWLTGVAAGVYAMVVLGGVTRLTRSGLSIVEWRPAGEPLPSTDSDWDDAFEKYKAFPEYQRVNSRMTLDEFKPIYFMEWAHRMWGRGLGVAFGVPLAALVVARAVPTGLGPRLFGLLFLGGTQGAIGWWMVKSGLDAKRFAPTDTPRVSPYRLATHLTGAWALYSLLAWTAMDLLRSSTPPTAGGLIAARAVRPAAIAAATLAGLTTFSGAFVAGNDAGRAYNDWPFFAGQLVPEGIWEDHLGIRNFFENTATVQFDHRSLAYATLASVGVLHAKMARVGGKAVVPRPVFRGAVMLGAAVAAQATLGIVTLMLYVPIALGAAHQAGALAVWTSALWTLHSVQSACRKVVPGIQVVGTSILSASPRAAITIAAATAALATVTPSAGGA
jgi:cytochrome c oxidase assembly protein subunit 15